MKEFRNLVEKYTLECRENYITKDEALQEDFVGIRIYNEPLIAIGEAKDPLFAKLKEEVIGDHYLLPEEWNDKCKTVISIFFPFTDEIIKSNALDKKEPSELWLHGRIEGQRFIGQATKYFMEYLNSIGYKSVAPNINERFYMVEDKAEGSDLSYTSNWSERHTAFICGSGTFGLSKGIITSKGMAGRFASIITEADFPVTKREYEDIYEYCTMCGACLKRCPVEAISFEKGKEHIPCSAFVNETKIKYKPRYGCGKCQTAVPCAKKIPKVKE